MALTYRQRRKWSLVILLVGLPLYIIVAFLATLALPRPNIALEILIYVVLGLVWAFPFRAVFRGVGKADPDIEPPSEG